MLVDIPQEPFLDDFGELLLLIPDSACLLDEYTAQGPFCLFLPALSRSVYS